MIKAGQRVLVIGPSGYGKTRLEMALLEGAQSVVVCDPKQIPDEWAAWGPQRGYVVTSDPLAVRRHPRVVLQVDDLWLQDRQGWKREGTPGWNWTEACRQIWARGNTTVVFTEGLALLPSAGANPFARKLITQGRARGLTSITDVQVANWTDTLMVRQANHVFCFRVTDEDAKLLAGRGADPAPLRGLADFSFGWHLEGAREWTVCAPLEGVWEPSRSAGRAQKNGSQRTTLPPSVNSEMGPETRET